MSDEQMAGVDLTDVEAVRVRLAELGTCRDPAAMAPHVARFKCADRANRDARHARDAYNSYMESPAGRAQFGSASLPRSGSASGHSRSGAASGVSRSGSVRSGSSSVRSGSTSRRHRSDSVSGSVAGSERTFISESSRRDQDFAPRPGAISRSGSVSGSRYASSAATLTPSTNPSSGSRYTASMAPSSVSRYTPSMAPSAAPSSAAWDLRSEVHPGSSISVAPPYERYQSDFHAGSQSHSGRSRSGSTSGSHSGRSTSRTGTSHSGRSTSRTGTSHSGRSTSRTGTSYSGRSTSRTGSTSGSHSGRTRTGSTSGSHSGRSRSGHGSTSGSASRRSQSTHYDGDSDDSDTTIVSDNGDFSLPPFDPRYQAYPGAPVYGAPPVPPNMPISDQERRMAAGLVYIPGIPPPGAVAMRLPDNEYYCGPASAYAYQQRKGLDFIPYTPYCGAAIPIPGARSDGGFPNGTYRGDGTMSSATKNAAPAGEVFWPFLKERLRTDEALLDLTVTCPICTESMRAVPTTTRKQAKILHCGHMLCDDCVTRICSNADGDRENPHGRKPECPFCKQTLGKHPHCGQSCPSPGRVGYPMPKNMAEMARLPRTMPEGGALPACCRVCRMKRLERMTRKMMRLITNEAHTTAFWEPTVDEERQNDGEFSDYIRIPELQPLLDHMVRTFDDPTIYRKYTNLYPIEHQGPHTAHAEMVDRARNST